MAAELRKAQWRTTMGADNRYHDAMNLFIGNFLELRQSKGTTEAMLHSRNDCLFHIIKHSSGIPLSLNRDAHSSSTAAGTRPDCHLAVRDWAPLVLVEEKANEGELVVATNELRTKFRWLPHYGNLPFVFAIAIAGDTIEFGRLDKSHAYMAFPGPGANGLARFCSAEEESLRGALNCIHAAINIGRCIRVMSTEFTMHLLHQPFNEAIHRHNKTLRITFEQVEKRYDPVRAVDRARMTAFYAETAGVECLEKGEVVEQLIRRGRAANGADDADDADDARNSSITFHLRPVGINALPLSSDTEGIRRCLKDLLTALSGVHALRWVVGDLRKPNVVLARAPRTTVKRYFVIDAAEYACRIGEELSEDKLEAAPRGWTGGGIATAQWDLRMLWDMVVAEKYETRAIRSMPHGEEFCAWLSGRFARSGGEEKSAADLLAHPFLDGVVPEPF